MVSLCCRFVSNWCRLIDPAIFPAAAQRHMLSPTTYARRCAGFPEHRPADSSRQCTRPRALSTAKVPEGQRMRSRTLTLLAAVVSTGLVLTACGTNSAPSGGTNSSSSSAPSGGGANGTVGVILPETATSARWEAFDKPMLTAALTAQGFKADVQNAQGDAQKFTTLADGFISQGVKVLVIAPSDPAVGAAVEAKAKNAGIPVIDYDRPSLGGSADYYVSFDNEKVGQLQGQGLADKLKDKPGASIVQIEGAPTDNNATLFTNGQDSVLKPLIESGKLKLLQKQP